MLMDHVWGGLILEALLCQWSLDTVEDACSNAPLIGRMCVWVRPKYARFGINLTRIEGECIEDHKYDLAS